MDEERLTNEQRRRMLDLFEQSALNDYPNPDRIGCPESEFLKRLAIDRKSIELSDPRLNHIPRCSPCFREFAEFRDAKKRATITRRALWVGGGTTALAVLTLVLGQILKLRKPRGADQGSYEQAELNLFNDGVTRGPEPPQSPPPLPRLLSRKRVELLITLPFASPEGDYEVQVVRASGESMGVTASGPAQLVNGKTLLKVRLDLTQLPPDSYKIGIRRIPYDWSASPVDIR